MIKTIQNQGIYGYEQIDFMFKNTELLGNNAGLLGGGIYNGDSGFVTMINCSVSENTAYDGAGQLYYSHMDSRQQKNTQHKLKRNIFAEMQRGIQNCNNYKECWYGICCVCLLNHKVCDKYF